ncbi:hypothetical protein [Gephyromycinifex aptenodytis]|uniref:hypothetical protein n=1 Tax=Gephyromycinifex aptenodytis TaxID=2716227 RepID=UPI0014453D6B|nr:hypothetical protein [Gephyromycinifex aptenodytis]
MSGGIGARSHRLVAAVDVGSTSLRDADAVAYSGVGIAPSVGINPDALVVSTHRVLTGSKDVHLTVAFCGAGAEEEQLQQLVLRLREQAGEASSGWAIQVGRYRVGSSTALEAAALGAVERASRSGGRCVHFPGVGDLIGAVPIGEVASRSAIETVVEMDGRVPAPDALLRTERPPHPRWQFGTLTLYVQPGVLGSYIPFESGPAPEMPVQSPR